MIIRASYTHKIVISLLLFLRIFSTQGQCFPGDLPSDRQALEDLYAALGRPISLTGWGSSDLSSWAGVSLVDGRVVGLDISGQGFSGILPASLNKLDQLQCEG